MTTKTIEERQAKRGEDFLQSKKENEIEIEEITKNWNYRNKGDLYPKISFAFNVVDDEYQILKGSITHYDIFSGKTKKKEVNQYTLFEERRQSFESNLASSLKADPGIKILTKKDNEWNMIKAFYDLPRGIERTQNKSSGSQNRRGRNSSKERIKISREAIEYFDEIFVVKFELNKGGQSGGRNSQDKEWNNYKIIDVYDLKEV